MDDLVPVPAARLAHLERVTAAAEAWLRAWTSAQSINSVTDNNTAQAFESSKQLAAALRAAST